MKILVTGASGFIGKALVNFLAENGYQVIAVVRHPKEIQSKKIEYFEVKDLMDLCHMPQAFIGVDVVVHLAGRAHIFKGGTSEQNEVTRVNVESTKLLADQSLASGVKRFIFISTIKVNGEETQPGQKYKFSDIPAPKDMYSVSKYQAEKKLQEVCENSLLDYVIIRPPLVYGVGVKANFLQLVKLVKLGLPLPFGNIKNKRSFISLENLVDVIALCIGSQNVKNRVLLVSDGEDISISELLGLIAKALNVKLKLININKNILVMAATVLGFRRKMHSLTSSLCIDIGSSQELLGWTPKYKMKDQLRLLIKQSNQK